MFFFLLILIFFAWKFCLQFISNEPNTLINVNVLSTDAKGNSRETVANGKTDAEEENTLDLVELSAPCTGPGCSERIYSDYEIITQNMGK